MFSPANVLAYLAAIGGLVVTIIGAMTNNDETLLLGIGLLTGVGAGTPAKVTR